MDYALTQDRRQRKRQELHQRLLNASATLFREHGVARTTVEDIAEAADVARQTVFNHFPYKEAIALELGACGIQQVVQRAYALLENGTPALEVLERTAEWVLDSAAQDSELAVVLAQELLHTDPGRSGRAAEQFPLREIFEAILVQAQEEGSVRQDLPLDVAASRISSILRTVLSQVRSYPIDQLKRELTVCMDIVYNGIRDRRTA
ncbi:MAG: TetR/AcrR family transcriptional regulator [Chloroflexota bacterium]